RKPVVPVPLRLHVPMTPDRASRISSKGSASIAQTLVCATTRSWLTLTLLSRLVGPRRFRRTMAFNPLAAFLAMLSSGVFPMKHSRRAFLEAGLALPAVLHSSPDLTATPLPESAASHDSSFDPWEAADSGSGVAVRSDRKSTRLNSSHLGISYAVFCLKKKNQQ